MGALHCGHLSLVHRAKKENDIVVVSIFVNPTQFGPHEDFVHYPRNLKKDTKILKGSCDYLFVPDVREMYAQGFRTRVEVGGLGELLCGRTRKGHFTGVATVVAKLFSIVLPQTAYFGQKDAQQAVIIKKMVTDLNIPVKTIVCPTVREKDGLAMSSRNAYLSEGERRDAVVLFQALKSAQRLVDSGVRESARIISVLNDFITRTVSARVEYIAIVDEASLSTLEKIERRALLLLAVTVGKTRLIDNMILKIKVSGNR
jgi:pantoate--beta-alanine ligase